MKLNLSERIEYREYYVSHVLPIYKVFLVCAFVFNVLLAFIDPIEIPFEYNKLSFIRTVILASTFASGFILLSIRKLAIYSPVVISVSAAVAALFMAYVSASSSYLETEFYIYFVGVVLSVLGTTLVLGIPYKMAIYFNTVVFLFYLAILIWQPPCTDDFCKQHHIYSLLLLGLTHIFSIAGCFLNDKRSQHLFKLQLEIKQDKENYKLQHELVVSQQQQVIHALQNLEDSKKQLNAVFNNVLIGILILDKNLKIKYGNPAIGELFDVTEAEVKMFEVRDFIPHKTREAILAEIEDLITNKKTEFYAETILQRKTSVSFWAQIKISKLMNDNGDIESLIAVISNIDKLKKSEIEIKNAHDQLTESLRYSARIQAAVLPNEDLMNGILPEHFIIFRPKNIISGDFYWAKKNEYISLIAVADCTGHGVPGALMSILGITLLNEIVNEIEHQHISTNSGASIYYKPSIMLDRLRDLVKTAMQQTGKEGEAKDGMDISLCVINWELRTLEYAGAYNPIYIVRNSEIIELDADRMPIGIYSTHQAEFQNIEFELMPNDTIYMTTDGYADQFGGIKERKFMSKNLKKLILSVNKESMQVQQRILNETLDEWKGDLEQADDILVLGFRIP